MGQLRHTYIIAQGSEGLAIVDQHAAHEQVLFETLLHGGQRANLEPPARMELTSRKAERLASYLNLLADLGLEIEPFGKNTYQVRAVPVVLGRVEDREAVHDIISDLLELGKVKDESTLHEKIIQIMACRSAIKTGDPLNMAEIHKLLEELYQLKNPYSCAHGRPTIIALTDKQLEKWFHRT